MYFNGILKRQEVNDAKLKPTTEYSYIDTVFAIGIAHQY